MTPFNYNWLNIISCELQEDWMYKLVSEEWNTYIVFWEEIQDNI